ncbi:MAG: sulfite exporter TauE/SafE family protein [Rothia sp. (in: high G+C Gram-positive bacteria)]|nr:sulfite exporter TauE/SafE family protein [Rothia sp. (in: high G+C Gram-positive bacteria)]
MLTLSTYPLLAWLGLGLAAFLVGLSKTLLPGVNTVSVAIFAGIMPAKISTGALLLLLILGDGMALAAYRRSAHWPSLIRMIPAVLLGLALGALFLHLAQDQQVRRSIGLLLLALMLFTLLPKRKKQKPAQVLTWVYGSLGGFSSMLANAGGPVMSLYFLARRFDLPAFLGTAAWFFASMNLLKLPFSLSLGLINQEVILVDAVLAPLVLAGGALGYYWAARIEQEVFNKLIILLTLAGALYLLR